MKEVYRFHILNINKVSKVKLSALFLLMQSIPNKFSDPCVTKDREVNRINKINLFQGWVGVGEQQKKMKKKKKKEREED